jgi:NifB/MoaA-like Fe-S oxidoreductase
MEVERLQREFRKTLGVTFAFLGDEIYVKAGVEIPSRRHYGNYPQIEDGVGMIRSFLNAFEKLLSPSHARTPRLKNVRTNAAAIVPDATARPQVMENLTALNGTILTGEMFAPILAGQIERYNKLTDSRLRVIAVPNTYFGGDVAVAGLLSGRDYLNVKDQIRGDFVIIPKHTIKSDEPILIDGMTYDDLKSQFPVPIYDLDVNELIDFLSRH